MYPDKFIRDMSLHRSSDC